MKKIICLVPLALLAGCFTLKQTEVPGVQLSHAPEGRDIRVAVSGFEATVTSYIPIYGYIYDVKTGALVEVPAATEVGKAQ